MIKYRIIFEIFAIIQLCILVLLFLMYVKSKQNYLTKNERNETSRSIISMTWPNLKNKIDIPIILNETTLEDVEKLISDLYPNRIKNGIISNEELGWIKVIIIFINYFKLKGCYCCTIS